MLLDGLSHNLERDCETSSTDQPCNQHHLKTEVDHLKLSDDRLVLTQEDQKTILFLAKECNEVEYSTFILSDKKSSANQLERDDQLLKSSLGKGITGENHDGFQSPKKVMDTISSAGLKCPRAPMKPKATPLMTKRKRESVNLQQDEFVNEVELVLSLLSSEEDKKLKRARLLAAGENIINDEAMN